MGNPGELLHTAIQETGRRTPGKIAVTAYHGQQPFTYSELASAVDRRSAALWHEGGIRPRMRVAVIIEHSPAVLLSLLAVMQCGAAFVPIDPSFPVHRIRWILEDANVSGIIISPNVTVGPQLVPLLSRLHPLTPDAVSTRPFPAREVDIAQTDLCYMIFTSGSTGRPKGVEIRHTNVMYTLHALAKLIGVGAEDVCLAATTVSFDISMVELFLPLLYGARVVIGNEIADPSLTLAQATPLQWRMWREQGWQGNRNLTVLCGGEAMPRDVADWLLRHTRTLYNVYGPTETTIWSTASHIEDADQINIGAPLHGEHVHILDDQLQPVPIGEDGEICIGGIGLARGYWNRAELTAQKFVSNPQRPEERLFRTGDLGYVLPSGALQCLGRLDHQIKLHGYRIELGEIEEALNAREGLGRTIVRVRQQGQARNLVAFISEQHASIDHWSEIWDTAYAQEEGFAERTDETTNYSGYFNSLSPGELHREESIIELQDTTTKRILGLHPQRVLEMGMGMGMVLFRIAPHCSHYHGSDVSPTACRYVQSILTHSYADLDVRVSQGAAHEFDRLTQGQELYDLVVINGTVAYFPNLEYLVEVIVQARSCLRPGGCLFLGDLRSAPHLDHFAAAAVAGECGGEEQAFGGRVAQRIDAERELLIDAGWFSTWAGEYFETVELQLHRGWDHNEFTMFRFDALLFMPREESQERPPAASLIPWGTKWDITQVGTHLHTMHPESLGFSGVPNARLNATAKLLGRRTSGSPVEPEQCYVLAEELGYRAQVIWSSVSAECFDVLFVRADCTVRWLCPPSVPAPQGATPAPAARRLRPREVTDLRTYLGSVLPTYMIPSEYIAIDRVPHTPNGKIDTQALLALKPDSEEHANLRSLIASVLGVDEELLKPDTRLLDLGIDSLTAIRLRLTLADELGIRTSLHELIGQGMTLATLQRAALIGKAKKDAVGIAVQTMPVEMVAASGFDLSIGQQQILAAVQLAGARNPLLYTARISFQLLEPINRSKLQCSLVALVDRHPMLRVVVCNRQQQIRPVVDVALSKSPEALLHPFDLSTDVPLRVCLSDKNHRVDIAAHHFAVDGRSLRLLAVELLENCAHSRTQSNHPPLATYSGFVTALQRQDEIRRTGFWTDTLRNVRATYALPYDRPPQTQRLWTGGTIRRTLSEEEVASLHRLGSKTTLPSVLVALAATLLQRYAQDREFVIGLLSEGRSRIEWFPVIGHFVRLLPIRLGFAEDTVFADIAIQAQQRILDALDHQNESIPKVSISVVVNYYALPAPEIDGIQTLFPDQQEGQFDLAFWFIRHADGSMHLEVKYGDDRFERGTAELMADHLKGLVQASATDSDIPTHSLAIQEADRTAALVDSWNCTATDIDHGVCIHSMIDAVDEDAPAVDELTYGQFRIRTDNLAQRIHRATGGDRTIRVGLYMRRNTSLVVAIMAALKSGQAYVPLEPSYPLKRLHFMVDVAAVSVIITQTDLMADVRHLFLGATVIDADDLSACNTNTSTEPLPAVEPEATAYIIFTSGTTGRPKGVMVRHRALSNRIQWMHREYTLLSSDVVLQKTPFTFDVSIWEFVWPLIAGARLVVADPDLHMEPGRLLQFVAEQNVTVIHFVPSMLRLFLEHPRVRPHCLRHIFCSGESLSPALRDLFFDSPLRHVRLHNLYGPTEACIDVSFWQCRPDDSGIVPIGRPVSNTQLYIVNDGQLAAPCCLGELWIGGVQVAAGYVDDADQTAERFIPNPFGAGMIYRTGDLARWRHDGEIVFLGRIDRQVKLHGQRLELCEVEAVLHLTPNVRQALAVIDEQVEGQSRLVAFVAPADLRVADVRAFAHEHLAASMMPAVIFPVDGFPTSAHGKVDVNSLLQRMRTAEPSARQGKLSYRPPETESERQVAEQFKVLLNLEQPSGRDDDFFAIGGDSLSAIRLVVSLERAFGCSISLSVVLETPTVCAIAARIDAEPLAAPSEKIDISDATLPSEVETMPEGVSKAYRVTDMQAHMLDQYGYYYHCREIFRIESKQKAIDPLAFVRAFAAQVERHPPLRSRFWRVSDGWAQGFRHHFDLQPRIHDLRRLAAGEQERILHDRVELHPPRLFCVEEGDFMFRAELFWLNNKAVALLLEVHHAIYDGWSDAIVIAQTVRDYVHGDVLQGTVARTLLERIALESKAAKDQSIAEFWNQRVEGARRLMPPASHRSLAMRKVVLSDETVQQVERCRLRERVTIRAVFLSAFSDLIHQYRDEDCIGVVTNTRTPQMTDPLDAAGMFWNLLPVRHTDGDLGVLQQQLREMEMDNRAHYPPSRLPRVSDSVFMFTDYNIIYDEDLDLQITIPWMSDWQNTFLHLTVLFKEADGRTRIVLNAPAADIGMWCERYHTALTEMCRRSDGFHFD